MGPASQPAPERPLEQHYGRARSAWRKDLLGSPFAAELSKQRGSKSASLNVAADACQIASLADEAPKPLPVPCLVRN
jgi:hypothetical protein